MVLKNGPHIRPMDFGDENGYGKDMAILWAAYRAGTFDLPPNLDQVDFAEAMIDILTRYQSAWIAEDRNDSFEEKRGPVGILFVESDGTIVKPHANYFKWATSRNMLRCTVAFFNWVRYSKDVGVCVVRATNETHNMHWRMRDYEIMMTYVGNRYFVLTGEKQ